MSTRNLRPPFGSFLFDEFLVVLLWTFAWVHSPLDIGSHISRDQFFRNACTKTREGNEHSWIWTTHYSPSVSLTCKSFWAGAWSDSAKAIRLKGRLNLTTFRAYANPCSAAFYGRNLRCMIAQKLSYYLNMKYHCRVYTIFKPFPQTTQPIVIVIASNAIFSAL